MTNSIALPRIKSRRKKRKPPSKAFILAIFFIVCDCFWLGYDLVYAITAKSPIYGMIAAAMMIACIAFPRYGAWYVFVREYTAWKKDNDD